MRIPVSLAVALAALPVGVAIADSSLAPPPPSSPAVVETPLPPLRPRLSDAALRLQVRHLSARARAHARRLGLTDAPPVRPAGSGWALAEQRQRLSWVVAFLAGRREAAPAADGRTVASVPAATPRLPAEYTAVIRLSRRLGLDRPPPPRAGHGPEGYARQRGRLQAIAAWLAARSERVAHYDALMCIAEHESSRTWDISSGNGYYGGLQMDIGFQRAYGPGLYRTKGTADNWTAEEQLRVAERAIASRGFTPWPNTARACGVL